ncbi:MAG: nitrous oxide reductase family maturation protein NosD [Rubrivivax sp.]
MRRALIGGVLALLALIAGTSSSHVATAAAAEVTGAASAANAANAASAENAASAPDVAQAPALQPLLDAAPPGARLALDPITYRGPAVVRRAVVLDGGGRARIEGDGRSSVLAVVAEEGVTLRGLLISGSGASHDRIDSGIVLQGRGHQVLDNRLDDVLFGIHLQGASNVRVAGNHVRGKPLPPGLRGDALRLWNSHGNRIEDNRFERARDLTLINSPDNTLARNRFADGRYGLHAVFSPRLVATGNRFEHTGTGVVVLYSPGLRLTGNHVAHAGAAGGAGIVVKECDDVLVEGNEVLHNAVGMKLDTPPAGAVQRLVVRGNRFAHNTVGLFFYGEAGSGEFAGNRFEHNLTTVAVSAPGAGAGHRFRGNRWDEYQGFDRDGDGIGDLAHEVLLFADRLWMELPMAGFFRASPALELLDFLERLAPFISPARVLLDPQPSMGAGPMPVPAPTGTPAPSPLPVRTATPTAEPSR